VGLSKYPLSADIVTITEEKVSRGILMTSRNLSANIIFFVCSRSVSHTISIFLSFDATFERVKYL
jgi:hypothetical protein